MSRVRAIARAVLVGISAFFAGALTYKIGTGEGTTQTTVALVLCGLSALIWLVQA